MKLTLSSLLVLNMLLNVVMNLYICTIFKKDGYLKWDRKPLRREYLFIINVIPNQKATLPTQLKCELTLMNLLSCLVTLLFHLKLGLSITFLKYVFLTASLLVIAFIDFKTKFIYTQSILIGVIGTAIFMLFERFKTPMLLFEPVLAACLCYGFIYLIVKLTHGMGEGDAEIAGLCGLALGIVGGVMTLILGTLIGALMSLIFMLFKKLTPQDEIPFGPFLVVGALITMLYQNEILNWYFTFFT